MHILGDFNPSKMVSFFLFSAFLINLVVDGDWMEGSSEAWLPRSGRMGWGSEAVTSLQITGMVTSPLFTLPLSSGWGARLACIEASQPIDFSSSKSPISPSCLLFLHHPPSHLTVRPVASALCVPPFLSWKHLLILQNVAPSSPPLWSPQSECRSPDVLEAFATSFCNILPRFSVPVPLHVGWVSPQQVWWMHRGPPCHIQIAFFVCLSVFLIHGHGM